MFVFVGATDGKIELHVEQQRIGAAAMFVTEAIEMVTV